MPESVRETPGFLQLPCVRVNQSGRGTSDVSGLRYAITQGDVRERQNVTEASGVDLISRVYRVRCKRIAGRNGRRAPRPRPSAGRRFPGCTCGRVYNPGIIPCLTYALGGAAGEMGDERGAVW